MPPRPSPLRVRFWGVRGSIPCPGRATAKVGGNTSCIEVLGGTDVVILDAGTGLRELGMRLAAERRPLRIHLLISHTHWDHIQGFPFFPPIYSPGNEIFVYGPRALEKSLEDAVMFQMQYSYFPVRGVELAARVKFTELEEGSFKIADLEISTKTMNHPIRVLAYKIAKGGRVALYTGDNEPYYDVLASKSSRLDTGIHRRSEFIKECNEKVGEFVHGTHLLIADSQYTDEEYERKRGWGHSSITHVLDLAARASVERVALFHHEPTHGDGDMERIEKEAKKSAKKRARKLEVILAREGMVVDV